MKRKKIVSEEEVDLVRRCLSEALVARRSTSTGRRPWPDGAAGSFRIEVGTSRRNSRGSSSSTSCRRSPSSSAGREVPWRICSARFDENASRRTWWDPAARARGDPPDDRGDGRRFRVVRDDTFVRSLEMLEEETGASSVSSFSGRTSRALPEPLRPRASRAGPVDPDRLRGRSEGGASPWRRECGRPRNGRERRSSASSAEPCGSAGPRRRRRIGRLGFEALSRGAERGRLRRGGSPRRADPRVERRRHGASRAGRPSSSGRSPVRGAAQRPVGFDLVFTIRPMADPVVGELRAALVARRPGGTFVHERGDDDDPWPSARSSRRAAVRETLLFL